MPLLDKQIIHMDAARMTFAEQLNNHCHMLREELRISELLLHSVLRSLSVQTPETTKLEAELTHIRSEGSMHKPYINDSNRQSALNQIEDALKGATKRLNDSEDTTTQ